MSQGLAPKGAGERRRDRRLEEIEGAARRLFATRGFTETSLAEIADEVDLSPKAIYYYFPSKRAILDSILERGFVYFEAAQLAEARAQWESLALREALVESGVAAVDEIVGHADLLRLSLSETFRGTAETRSRHETYMHNWVKHVEAMLSRPTAGDSISPTLCRPLAEVIVEALFGLGVDSVLRGRDHAWSKSKGVSERRRYVERLIDALVSTAYTGSD